MTILRFNADQAIIEKGEVGTWLGILLSGALLVGDKEEEANGVKPTVARRGAVLGEFAFWCQGHKRMESVRGHEAGLIATILVEEMHALQETNPIVANKLMRMIVGTALQKQAIKLRNARAQRLGPNTVFASATKMSDVHSSAPAILSKHLYAKGFSRGEAALVCKEVSYFEVPADTVLLEAGQTWPYVVFVIRGSVSYDAWNWVVAGEAQEEDGSTTPQFRMTVSDRVASNARRLAAATTAAMQLPLSNR